MGQRGPAAKPVELKVLEGNRGNRPLNLDQVFRPEVGVPPMPKAMSAEAKKAWRRLTPELVHYNLLSKVDADAFAMLCRTIGRCELAERSLLAAQNRHEAAGEDPMLAFTASTPNGLRIQSVTYQVLNREQQKLHSLLKSFGLRPDARAAVTTAIRSQLTLFEGGGGGDAGQGGAGAGEKPAAPAAVPTSFADW